MEEWIRTSESLETVMVSRLRLVLVEAVIVEEIMRAEEVVVRLHLLEEAVEEVLGGLMVRYL